MKLTVYIDVLISVNTIINYFLLKIAAVRLKLSPDSRYFILSSVVSALFSLFVLADLNSAAIIFIRIISLVLSAYLAFGYTGPKLFIKCLAYVFSVNSLFTGMLVLFFEDVSAVYINNHFYYIYINPILLVILVTVVYALIVIFDLISGCTRAEEITDITITLEDKSFMLKAFYDTGFAIRDLVTMKTLMLCSYTDTKQYLSQELKILIEECLSNNCCMPGVTPVFYSDISSSGIIPGIKRDKIKYKNREYKNILIAFCNGKLSDDFQIIFGKDLYYKLEE